VQHPDGQAEGLFSRHLGSQVPPSGRGLHSQGGGPNRREALPDRLSDAGEDRRGAALHAGHLHLSGWLVAPVAAEAAQGRDNEAWQSARAAAKVAMEKWVKLVWVRRGGLNRGRTPRRPP